MADDTKPSTILPIEPQWSPYPVGNGWIVDPYKRLDAYGLELRNGVGNGWIVDPYKRLDAYGLELRNGASDVLREAYERKINS